MSPGIPLTVIGTVRTGYADPEHTPIQAGLNSSEQAVIEVAAAYQEGLDSLTSFDYAWVLTWLGRPGDQAGPAPLRQVPFLLRGRGTPVGVFATRGPRRVNPIGLSLIRLLDVTAGVITFTGVDFVDGTPVVDIKPYVTRFDRPPGEPRSGWIDTVPLDGSLTPADLAHPEP